MRADDFFKALFEGGYVPRFVWKNIAIHTTRYSVQFVCGKCAPKAVHTVEIIVKDGVHTIRDSSVIAFCKYHGINI